MSQYISLPQAACFAHHAAARSSRVMMLADRSIQILLPGPSKGALQRCSRTGPQALCMMPAGATSTWSRSDCMQANNMQSPYHQLHALPTLGASKHISYCQMLVSSCAQLQLVCLKSIAVVQVWSAQVHDASCTLQQHSLTACCNLIDEQCAQSTLEPIQTTLWP